MPKPTPGCSAAEVVEEEEESSHNKEINFTTAILNARTRHRQTERWGEMNGRINKITQLPSNKSVAMQNTINGQFAVLHSFIPQQYGYAAVQLV